MSLCKTNRIPVVDITADELLEELLDLTQHDLVADASALIALATCDTSAYWSTLLQRVRARAVFFEVTALDKPNLQVWETTARKVRVVICSVCLPGCFCWCWRTQAMYFTRKWPQLPTHWWQACRKVAKINQIKTVSSLHFTSSKRIGLLPCIAPLIEQITASPVFMSERLIQTVLELAGETTQRDQRHEYRLSHHATRQIGTVISCAAWPWRMHWNDMCIHPLCQPRSSIHLHDMLTAKGIEFTALDANAKCTAIDDLAHSQWLAQSITRCARYYSGAIGSIVDADCWPLCTGCAMERKMRGFVKQVMVIDDIADRQHDCDMLLDQNFYADMQTRYTGKVPAHCQLLLGTLCVAAWWISKIAVSKWSADRTGQTNPVFLGGVDADNYTGRVIKALAEMISKGCMWM